MQQKTSLRSVTEALHWKERIANIHDCMVYNNQQFSPHHSEQYHLSKTLVSIHKIQNYLDISHAILRGCSAAVGLFCPHENRQT
jgi:hypothetical protein